MHSKPDEQQIRDKQTLPAVLVARSSRQRRPDRGCLFETCHSPSPCRTSRSFASTWSRHRKEVVSVQTRHWTGQRLRFRASCTAAVRSWCFSRRTADAGPPSAKSRGKQTVKPSSFSAAVFRSFVPWWYENSSQQYSLACFFRRYDWIDLIFFGHLNSVFDRK